MKIAAWIMLIISFYFVVEFIFFHKYVAKKVSDKIFYAVLFLSFGIWTATNFIEARKTVALAAIVFCFSRFVSLINESIVQYNANKKEQNYAKKLHELNLAQIRRTRKYIKNRVSVHKFHNKKR